MRRSSGRIGIAFVGTTVRLAATFNAVGRAGRAARPSLLRAALVGTLASLGLLVSAASALAAIDLGPGDEPPSIVYDATTGYTYVAWQDSVSDDTVDLCVVASGGTACNGGSGPYQLTDPLASSESYGSKYFGYKVLVQPDGNVVVLALVLGGNPKIEPSGYTQSAGEIAWSSPANGEAFGKSGQGIANGGKLLAEAQGEMPDQGAVAIGATNILTYGNEHPFGSGATDFSLTSPALKETPLVETIEEFSDNGFGSLLAAEEDPAKSGEYLAVIAGFDAGTPKECGGGSDEGTGYSVAKGTPAALQKQTAWGGHFKAIACPAEEPALTGGMPSTGAIGIVDSEGPGLNGGGEEGIYYRPFIPGSDTFGGPTLISQEAPFTLDGAGAVSASDDATGGVYAAWSDGRGLEFSYSNTGGSSWLAPVTAIAEGASHPSVAGVGGGSAEVAYFADNGSGTQEYLQPFSYGELVVVEQKPAPVIPPPQIVPTATATSTSQAGGGVSGASLTLPQGTAVTDQAFISGTNAANATGTVTYNIYKNNRCTIAATAGSVESVVKGVGTPSAAVKLAAGTYYWQATYSGDTYNASSTSKCGSEILVVALVSKTPLGLPSSKVCLSRRKFLVHPRAPKGVKLVSVEVQINGKFVKKGKLNAHATSVSLVGLPKGTFKVALITTSSKGKIYEEVRTFHTCVPGKHKG
jgi:hypothetical protein